ncbi:MAG TPA: ligase [Caldimonas sp.]
MSARAQPAPSATTGTAADVQRWNEAALARPVEATAWRLWAYREPAVVLGCSQRRMLADLKPRADVEVLVRASGGGAVLVGPWMLGLSALLPAAHPLVSGGPVPSYRWLGECLAQSLQQVGIAAAALSPEALRARRGERSASALDWACFAGLSPWEVLVGERKIAGLAQVRRRHGVLLVAGVLLQPPPWTLICDRLGRPLDEARLLALASTSCTQERVSAEPAPLVAALSQALTNAVQTALKTGSPSDPDR